MALPQDQEEALKRSIHGTLVQCQIRDSKVDIPKIYPHVEAAALRAKKNGGKTQPRGSRNINFRTHISVCSKQLFTDASFGKSERSNTSYHIWLSKRKNRKFDYLFHEKIFDLCTDIYLRKKHGA